MFAGLQEENEAEAHLIAYSLVTLNTAQRFSASEVSAWDERGERGCSIPADVRNIPGGEISRAKQ